MIMEALEKHRENIVQKQVAAGREFKVPLLFLVYTIEVMFMNIDVTI